MLSGGSKKKAFRTPIPIPRLQSTRSRKKGRTQRKKKKRSKKKKKKGRRKRNHSDFFPPTSPPKTATSCGALSSPTRISSPSSRRTQGRAPAATRTALRSHTDKRKAALRAKAEADVPAHALRFTRSRRPRTKRPRATTATTLRLNLTPTQSCNDNFSARNTLSPLSHSCTPFIYLIKLHTFKKIDFFHSPHH